MKKPFDTIVGPDGVWKDDEGSDLDVTEEFGEREEFALRCLNAAANLYGVLPMESVARLYNIYAKDHASPLSDEMTVEELSDVAERLLDRYTADDEGLSTEEIANRPEVWFSQWRIADGEPLLIVWHELTSMENDVGEDEDDSPEPREKLSDADVDRRISRRIAGTLARFAKCDLKILPEDEFLQYEEPTYVEATKGYKALVKFLRKAYNLEKFDAEMDADSILSHVRFNGAKIIHALEYAYDWCSWTPPDYAAFSELADVLAPAVAETRTWEGCGRSVRELVNAGLCEMPEPEDLGEEAYDRLMGDNLEEDDSEDENEFENDDYSDYILPEDIPVSRYDGPIDFAFVKDQERRDAKLAVYEDVSQVTRDIIERKSPVLLTAENRKAAAVRLGFLERNGYLELLPHTLDCVVGDFACMIDERDGGPAIKRLLKDRDSLGEIDRRALTYYENYRYTWLEVLAVKAGVGVKCRDLLTGDELFLMETRFSRDDVKGMTVCTGISPMEDVYIVTGVLGPAHFKNPAAELKSVLSDLGLPTELPVRLSSADQARFAAETIRRIRANGWFDNLILG